MTRRSNAPSQGHVALPTPAGDRLLTLLALAAGCVDAVSYLGLGHVLTAAMTGNTVLLGLALGQADLAGALRSTIALIGFFAGVMVGAAIVRRTPTGLIWSPAMMAALAVELMVLVALAVAWQLAEGTEQWRDERFPLIAAAGLAMGIQSAVAYRIGVSNIATTYVTGTLTSMGTRLVGWPGRRAPRGDHVGEVPSWVPASVWAAYGCGAVFAGATHLWWPTVDIVGDVRWPSAALLLPIAIVTTATLIVRRNHRRLEPGVP